MNEKELLEKHYQNHHEVGDRYGYLVCHGSRKPLLHKWIGEGKKILDLGCRDGELSASFINGNEVIGVDVDRAALQKAEENHQMETLWVDLNKEWPFAKKSFDVIVACELLEHLFFIERIMEDIFFSLKEGGLFIGSVPNSFRMRNRWKFLWGKEFDKDPTHVHRFSYKSLYQLLSSFYTTPFILPLEGKVSPFFKVEQNTPLFFGKRFSKMFLWKAKKES